MHIVPFSWPKLKYILSGGVPLQAYALTALKQAIVEMQQTRLAKGGQSSHEPVLEMGRSIANT